MHYVKPCDTSMDATTKGDTSMDATTIWLLLDFDVTVQIFRGTPKQDYSKHEIFFFYIIYTFKSII